MVAEFAFDSTLDDEGWRWQPLDSSRLASVRPLVTAVAGRDHAPRWETATRAWLEAAPERRGVTAIRSGSGTIVAVLRHRLEVVPDFGLGLCLERLLRVDIGRSGRTLAAILAIAPRIARAQACCSVLIELTSACELDRDPELAGLARSLGYLPHPRGRIAAIAPATRH